MKSKLLFGFLMSIFFSSISAQDKLPVKSEVISSLKLVNNYWQATHPDHGDREWANAVYYTGNTDLYNLFPKYAYLTYALDWANKHDWYVSGGTTTVNADQQCAGQTYIDLFHLTGGNDSNKIAAIDATMSRMVDGDIDDAWWWIDALYMAMPGFVKLGLIHEDTAYFEQMYKLYSNTKISRNLYNTQEGLWYRDEAFLPQQKLTPNGEDIYWSRGNGWVFAAHVRVLKLLPDNARHREEYEQTFKEMARALIERQREDGLWNPSLDDPNDFGGPETSGTSFLVYGLAWGINSGLLDSATYYPSVQKAWEGLTTISLHDNGYVGYIQGVGSQPSSSQPVRFNSNADFGVGAFLMAGTEVALLAAGELPEPSDLFMLSVDLQDQAHIEVRFSDIIEVITATDAANYSFSGDIQILNIQMGDNDSSVRIEVDTLDIGMYTLSAKNIWSRDGEKIEEGEFKTFTYAGDVRIAGYSHYQENTSNVPENTLDLNFSTRWSAEGNEAWLIYDLGSVKMIESVDIAFYNGDQRQAFFEIEISEDLDHYASVFNGASNGSTPETEFQNFDFDNTAGRYVRFTGFGNSSSMWNSVTEVRINYSDNTSIEESATHNNNGIHIFPNPVQDKMNMIGDFKSGRAYDIAILDLAGKLVYTEKVFCQSQKTLMLANPGLRSGIYLISIKNEMIRFVVN